MKQKLSILLNFLQKESTFTVFLVLFLFASFTYEQFFTVTNLTNVLRQVSMKGLVAMGMTFVILTGGIDLSVGSLVALSGVLAAFMSRQHILLVLPVVVFIGCLAGLMNGLIITKLRIVPFIATLATMMGLRGFAYIITDVQSITIDKNAHSFEYLGRGYFLGIPLPTIIFIVLLCIAVLVSTRTGFGRSVYAVGGNEKASRMMGLKTDKTKILCYIISGGLTALAGTILSCRLGAGQAVGGEGWEIAAIAAVAIGGTYFSGGVGKFTGTFYGILILGIITNVINLQGNISSWWQKIATGFLLLLVVIIQSRIQQYRKEAVN